MLNGEREFIEIREEAEVKWQFCQKALDSLCQEYVTSKASKLAEIAREIRSMTMEDFAEIEVLEKNGNKEYEIKNSKIEEEQIKNALAVIHYGKTNVELIEEGILKTSDKQQVEGYIKRNFSGI